MPPDRRSVAEFQSLFYWNGLLRYADNLLAITICVVVSILVLLEWSSEASLGAAVGGGAIRFNPCSIGMVF